jgi:2-polyprenyl-3-methyl-5-hydroxy-6-metoxy-1,4-benzoquinol methylase
MKNEYNKELSSVYNKLNGAHKYIKEVEYLSKFLHKKCKILDVGCGTGTHIFMLEKLGHQCTGIDSSANMISVATKNKDSKATFINIDIQYYNTTEKYDLCISLFNVVNHVLELKSLETFFKSIHKKLKKDGMFIFDCFNNVAVLKDRPKQKVSKNIKITPEFDPYTGILMMNYVGEKQFKLTHRIWDLSLMIEMLQNIGFDVEFYNRNTSVQLKDDNYKATFICRRIK